MKIIFFTILFINIVWANFHFDECSGSGSFEQQIINYKGDYENTVLVDTIPVGIIGLRVELTSDKDVDIRLYGENKDKVVHWPYGILSREYEESTLYKDVNVTYSGYNGVNGEKGHEFIELSAATPTSMMMKAFGYKAGYATVTYSWTGKVGCTPKESGTDSFTQSLEKDSTSLVGTIPKNVKNVHINLTSDKDLDIQLYGEDGTAIVSWKPQGLLSGSMQQSIEYHGMQIIWSGYHGVDAKKGHEYITITPKTTELLTMKVYGYSAGNANVSYTWGEDTDITAPIITLQGSNPQSIELGSSYTELGATTDDGSAVTIDSSEVNTSKIGTYTVSYYAKDSSENSAEILYRTIQVEGKKTTCTLNQNFIQGNTFENENDLNQWAKVSGDGYIVRENYSTGWAGSAPSDAGDYFLYATGGNSVIVKQEIALNDCLGDDTLYYSFNSYFGTYGKGDSIEVKLEFQDKYNNVTGTYNTEKQTPDKVMETYSHTNIVPDGTDKIIVYMILEKVDGNDIDGYVDNISLMLIDKPNLNYKNLKFDIAPFLQLPSSSSMTVRFEPKEVANKEFTVYYKEQSASEYKSKYVINDTSGAMDFRYATMNGLKSNKRYDYYIESKDSNHDTLYASPIYSFMTYPSTSDSIQKLDFLALSDTQTSRRDNTNTSAILGSITDAVIKYRCNGDIKQCDTALRGITVSGDVVDNGGTIDQWRKDFFGHLAKITPYVPLIPTTGNHDYYGDGEAENYRIMFMLPSNTNNGDNERYYDLKIGNMHILALDSYRISKKHGNYNDAFRKRQLGWLEDKLNDFKNDTSTDVVVSIFHHGCLSSMWVTGESVGSCENVRALENFTQESGKVSGHLFGHTHAYARGVSRDTKHLWLNTASAAGYREPLDTTNDTFNYDTFSISSSQFGFTILSINGEGKGTLSIQRYRGDESTNESKNKRLSSTFKEHYDALHVKNKSFTKPIIENKSVSFDNINNTYIEIVSDNENAVEEVEWQISTSSDFSKSKTVNVWGKSTKKKNIWYSDNGTIEGSEYNMQEYVDIFQLKLSNVDGKHFENDEVTMWKKRTDQQSHTSKYKSSDPIVIHFSLNRTYYWRARVRDENMNWSNWTDGAQFKIE